MIDLIVDEKITSWRRNYVSVEANTIEEAIEEIKKDSEKVEYTYSVEEFEWEEPVRDENGNRIIEIMDQDYNTLYEV